MAYKTTTYRVLQAQKENLARIATGLILDGTYTNGENIVLSGPAPDVIRLDDTPLRLLEQSFTVAPTTIITLSPVFSNTLEMVVNRVERMFSYQILAYTQLTPAEVEQEAAASYANDPPLLSAKIDKLIHDIQAVFYDDYRLDGLFEHQRLDYRMEQSVLYPGALVVFVATGQVSEMWCGG